MYKVETSLDVENDLVSLPEEVLLEVLSFFERYKTEPFQCSQPLYKQGVRDLRGCRKTYVANAAYRIIIQVENDVAKIVSIVCVGERQDMSAYDIAFKRISPK
ncbi:MAG: hypothetical protein WCW84_10625 [Sulfurimonas sp.]|jgi:mRNA interferase RelE/StbE